MPRQTARQRRAAFHFALGHPRRLRIVEALMREAEPLTFEEIGCLARIPRSSLSHHMRYLLEADIIERKIKGRHSHFGLNAARLNAGLAAPTAPAQLAA